MKVQKLVGVHEFSLNSCFSAIRFTEFLVYLVKVTMPNSASRLTCTPSKDRSNSFAAGKFPLVQFEVSLK